MAFSSNRAGEYDLYLADLAGTATRALTGMDGDDFHPTFTPDGSRIVFSGMRSGQVGLFEVDVASGATVAIPTPGLVRASAPALSRDGCCLAFEGVPTNETQFDVYFMRRGSTPVRLTTTSAREGAPAFSPDGVRVYFVSNRDGPFQLFSIAIDGTGLMRITTTPGVLGRPSVSPSGAIAFTRFDTARGRSVIVELDPTTGVERALSDNGDSEPSYSWTGDHLAFTTTRFGGAEVMLLELGAGSAARRMTIHPAIDGMAALSP